LPFHWWPLRRKKWKRPPLKKKGRFAKEGKRDTIPIGGSEKGRPTTSCFEKGQEKSRGGRNYFDYTKLYKGGGERGDIERGRKRLKMPSPHQAEEPRLSL